MISGITPENLLRTLPHVLRQDDNMYALAAAVSEELSALSQGTALAAIYANIDTLPEEVLDTLARDFKVDWWSFDYTAEEKRRTLKNSWYVHRHLGTKSAVERALSAVYEGSQVTEWFEYGGKPYHFKLIIPVDISGLDTAKHSIVLGLVAFYKNLRSVLDNVEYHGSTSESTAYVLAAGLGCEMSDSLSVYFDNSGHVSAAVETCLGAAGLGYEISDSSEAEYDNSGHVSAAAYICPGVGSLGYEVSDSAAALYDNGSHISAAASAFAFAADVGCEIVD